MFTFDKLLRHVFEWSVCGLWFLLIIAFKILVRKDNLLATPKHKPQKRLQ